MPTLLAAVRGEVLTRKAEPADALVVFDAGAPDAPAKGSFAQATETPLELLMLCFALAIDLGAGIALHRARTMSADSDGRAAVERELAAVRESLGAVVAELTALRNAPGEFAARFWRDFHRTMLTDAARRAIIKGLALVVVAGSLSSNLWAGERLNLVVALDLSLSEAAAGEDQKSPFERNVEGIARLLASAPAGTRVTVIGITRDSIADPAPLLAAQLSADSGYFDERLAAGRANLVRAWRARATHLAPTAAGTDIIGALFLAGEIFRKEMTQSRKILALYSDMRHATAALNMEVPHWGPATVVLKALDAQHQIADLAGVTVYVQGANGGGREVGEWQEVRAFWTAYFGRAGARCDGYSILATPVRLE